MSGGGDPGERLYTLEEMDRYVLPRAADIRLTISDVILLLLGAAPGPLRDKAALVSQVFLAVTGPLARSGVEPIAFRRGREGRPRSDDVELALDHLAFTRNVDAIGCRGGRAGPCIAITARGRSRMAETRRGLPAAVRSALASKRAEWGGDAPACGMKDATYVHNRELLERLPAPGGPGRDRGGAPAKSRHGSYCHTPAPRLMQARSWKSQSVRKMAGGEDPIDAVMSRARQMVVRAMDDGWSGPPYEPTRLAGHLGMAIRQNEDVPDARLVPGDDGRATVEYNPNRPQTRIRFSIAHEIAHTLFPDHAEKIRNRSYDTALNTDQEVETLCNMAAAEILMPVIPDSGDSLGTIPLTMADIVHMRDRFGVSTEAMMIRLAGITAHDAIIFCATRKDDARDSYYTVEYVINSMSATPLLKPGTSLRGMGVLSECTAVGYTTHVRKEKMPGTNETRRVECIGVPPHRGRIYPRIMGVVRPTVTEKVCPLEIEHVIGDATKPIGDGRKIIAHVANDANGKWGRGFGLALTRAFDGIRDDFLGWSKRSLRLGNAHVFDAGGDLTVFSMVAQRGLPRSGHRTIRYAYLATCLDKLAALSKEKDAAVHMPLIGTGYAGGSWDVVEDLLNRHLVRRGVRVTVYSRPGTPRPSRAQSLMDYVSSAGSPGV